MSDERDQWREIAKRKIENMPPEISGLRERAKNDLYFFARLVNPQYAYGDIHAELFKWLEDYKLYQEDQTTNKLIMLPRAHLKSHIVATFAAWLIVRHPEISILYVSATSELAETQLYAIKNILTSDVFTRYFPEYINPQEGRRARWNNSKIVIDHEAVSFEGTRDPTIATAGLTTNTTGWHADVILSDDVVVPENAYTETGRKLVESKCSQFTSIRNNGGFTVAAGTRYHPNDIYASWKEALFDVFDDNGILVDRSLIWDIQEYKVEVEGQFLWPRRAAPNGKIYGFDQRSLARIRGEYYDVTQYYAQYYNDPNDAGSNRISRDSFQYWDERHLKVSGGDTTYKGDKLNVYASIDFAYSLNAMSDYTAIMVVGIDSYGKIYVLDMARFQTDKSIEYFRAVSNLHSKWRFKKLRAEVTGAQSQIVEGLKDHVRECGLRLTVDPYNPPKNQSKQERMIAALEHRYANGDILHPRGGFVSVLEEELVQARPRHDDLKDALSAVLEIVVKPAASRNRDNGRGKVVKMNTRFGGGRVA